MFRGILLDATIVRTLLVPALVSVLGKWNWWMPTWFVRMLFLLARRHQRRAESV